MIEILLDKTCFPQAFRDNIAFLMATTVLFPTDIYFKENSTFAEHRIQIMTDLVRLSLPSLALLDIQAVVKQYALFIGNPAISFKTLKYILMVLTQLVDRLRFLPSSQRDAVGGVSFSLSPLVDVCYRITITVVRKLEDLQPIIKQDARIRNVKKAYLDAEASNARYIAFSKGENYVAPTPEYDQYGIRVTPALKDVEIGDIEIKESRYNTISLIQQLCGCLLTVIRFLNHPSPDDPVISASPLSMQNAERSGTADLSPIPMNGRFEELFYRYVVAVFHCGELYKVDETRTKEQVSARALAHR